MTGRGICQIRPRSPPGAVSRAMAKPCAGRSLSIARTVRSARDSDGSAVMILSVRGVVTVRGGRSGPRGPACSELRGDGLDLGVVVQHLVAHLAAPAGLLVAAERQRRVEHVVAVDPDRAGPELLGQRVGLGDVPGPDARAESVVT